MKNFIEIHILQNFAPSNLNRDDTGAPKDAFFGGHRRARISSQCLKNSVRKYFEAKRENGLFDQAELAIRTKRIMGKLVSILVKNGREEKEAREKVINAFNSLGFSFKENDKTEYLLFLGESEIARLANLILEKWDEIGDPGARLKAINSIITYHLFPDRPNIGKMNAILRALEIYGDVDNISDEQITAVENRIDEIVKDMIPIIDKIEPFDVETTTTSSTRPKRRKKSELNDWEKSVSEILKEGKKSLSPMGKILQKMLDGGKAIDLALFGRMLADMPEKNQNAACQVAHAISTHAVEREFDFYTAVDDLKPDDTSGADMMGTIEFNSACLYRYAVVDFEKLVENLQGDNDLALAGLRNFLEGFVVAEPTGKQNSFAAHNPPEFVYITVCKEGAPRNLANAFEVPIRVKGEESLTKESVKRLLEKDKVLSEAYGVRNATFIWDISNAFGKKDFQIQSLNELLNSVETEIKRLG